MYFMSSFILCFTFLNFLVLIHCAPKIPAEDSYGIVSTETAIRNTANNLFSTLNLKVMQNKLKLKQYSTIHNFFVSITLRDHDNLKKIAKLTEVENIDNGTQVFIAQLNEVLSEDNKSDEATDSVYVAFLIEDFINRIDQIKDKDDDFNTTKTFDLNKAIVKYFSNNEIEFGNTTYSNTEFVKGNDSDVNILDDNEFWQPSGRRIFKGMLAEIEHFPFIASVQIFKRFQCSGSIIKSDLIITSASCLQIAWNNRFFRENPLFLSVQVGSTFYDHGGEHIPILEIYFHPSFDPKTLRHNLAIMRLKSALKFGKMHDKVKKIDFDRNPWALPSNTDGIIVAGWGVRVFGGTIVASRKNKLSSDKLEFYPLDDCQEIYTKDFVTEKNFCAGFYSKGSGACNHDAGGPGISNGILVGVISFGAPVCGTPDAPTVFTKLGYYTDWIKEIVDMEVPTARQATTLRPNSFPTFRLPPVTRKAPIKVMPIIDGKPYQSGQPELVRTNEETQHFKELLKTILKKKKGQKRKGQNQVGEDETDEASPYESEEVTDSPYKSEEVNTSPVKPKKVTDSPHKIKKGRKSPHKSKKVKHSSAKTKKVKERQNFTIKPILKNKPSSSKTKKKSKHKEKNKRLTESLSQSQVDSEDEFTTMKPITAFRSDEITFIDIENVASSAEAPNSVEESAQTFLPRVDRNKEASSSQDTEFDEAIESLLDNLNLDYILKSKGSSVKNKEKKQEKTDKNKNDSNGESNEGLDNGSGEDEGIEENGSNEYENEKQISSDHESVTKSYKVQSTEDVDSHDSQENEDSKEVTDVVKRKDQTFRTEDKGETSDEEETDEDSKALSNTAETSKLDISSSNNTDKFIDMLEYEDIYKLLSGHASDR